jgi:hypothetical protein
MMFANTTVVAPKILYHTINEAIETQPSNGQPTEGRNLLFVNPGAKSIDISNLREQSQATYLNTSNYSTLI